MFDASKLAQGAAVAVIGAAVGWSANALTLSGRVDAIEKTLQRIESRLYGPQQPAGEGAK